MKHIQILIVGALICMAACQPMDSRSLALNKQMSSYEFVDDPHMQLLLDSSWISREIYDMIYDYPLCNGKYKDAVREAEAILDSLAKNGTPVLKMPFSLPMPCTMEQFTLFLKYAADYSSEIKPKEFPNYQCNTWERLLFEYGAYWVEDYSVTFKFFQDTLVELSWLTSDPVHEMLIARYGNPVRYSTSREKYKDYDKEVRITDHYMFCWQSDDLIILLNEEELNIENPSRWTTETHRYHSKICYKYRPGYASYRKKYHDLKSADQERRKQQEEEQRIKEEQAIKDKLQKLHDDSVARANRFLNSI